MDEKGSIYVLLFIIVYIFLEMFRIIWLLNEYIRKKKEQIHVVEITKFENFWLK